MVKISGLLRVADYARRQLAAPMTAVEHEQLRVRVDENIAIVRKILAERRAGVGDLPAPSRRAYLFLEGIDWNRTALVTPDDAEASANAPANKMRKVSWPHMTAFLNSSLDRLARDLSPEELAAVADGVARTSRRMELTIQRDGVLPEHLSALTRGQRGWLAYMSRAENVSAYVSARKTASRVIDAAASGSRHYPPPIAIHFRPVASIYKLQARRSGAVLWLATPMISFDESHFKILAEMMFRRTPHARQHMIELMTGDGYQTVRAELESLGGIAEQTRGATHDLGESFDRVNARYFNGTMARPRLTWNRTFTGRKFGHYDYIHDTLMVTRTLDSPKVPPFVVDFLMFHELLHKFHGMYWSNGRGYAHTAEFYASERKFERYNEAEAILEKLARGLL